MKYFLDEEYEELAKFFIPRCHPAIQAFLKDCPNLIYCPSLNRVDNGIYPDPEKWFEFGLVLECLAADRALTLTAKYILGPEVACIFPKFYLSKWPQIKAKESLIRLTNHIDGEI